MRLERVRFKNWLRYAGEHDVALTNTVYGIVGKYADDDRRSNWAGKTSFVEAIRFGLYGAHRHSREDGWITNGQNAGYVELTFNDGLVVRRERKRGQATQLTVTGPQTCATPIPGSAIGDAAQTVLSRAVGLSKADFDVTCWFGQKQLARLVLAGPAERFELVSGWFNLEPLQRCENRVRLALSDITTQVAQQQASAATFEQSFERLAAEHAPECATVPALRERLGTMRETAFAEVARRHVAVAQAREGVDACAGAQRIAEQAKEFDGIVEEGKGLNRQIEQVASAPAKEATATTDLMQARDVMTRAADELKQKRLLARGEFNGKCPVAGIECPATTAINARMEANSKLHESASAAYDVACKAEALARLEHESIAKDCTRLTKLTAQRDALRTRAQALLPAVKAANAAPPFDESVYNTRVEALQEAQRDLATAEGSVRDIERAQDALDGIALEQARIAKSLERLAADEHVARAALRIFGRQGAQKRIAEVALSEIEEGANDVLRETGINLGIKVQWGREGVGLATWCPECGCPYPASAKVKRCERCKAERGPKVVDRLDVELSDRSGAAEDLAGAALQLAAASWLRRTRDVGWSVALIDEPFGALDESNRKAFAAHLMTMLRGRHGFEQAFVVAHHADVLDGLPARIVVEAGDEKSTIHTV